MAKEVLPELARENALLAALPPAELARLARRMERVDLDVREHLYFADRPIRSVFFPIDGVCSVVGVLSSGQPVEIATVGREGFVGLPLFLGADRTPTEAFSQVPGSALRLGAGDFLDHIQSSKALQNLLHLYTQAMFTLVAQGSVCNRVHSMVERCARWLLLTHDRVDSDSFFLKQEFLAQMLGVRRASVTDAAGALQEQGLIRYARGSIAITDRRGLEAAACECYGIVRAEFDRLLGTAGERVPARRRRATARRRRPRRRTAP